MSRKNQNNLSQVKCNATMKVLEDILKRLDRLEEDSHPPQTVVTPAGLKLVSDRVAKLEKCLFKSGR